MSYPAFLAAIRDEPDNDLPRLVCADWLDDTGESDRAELIRTQIELTRGVKERGRALELLTRLRVLIRQHQAAWLGVLATHSDDSVFRRGFVEQAALTAKVFLDHGEAIFAAHPIYQLRLHELGRRAGEVAQCEQLACVATLDLSESPLSEDAAAALAASPHLTRCQTLDLRSTRLGNDGLRRLVSAGGLRPVQRLNLRDNDLTAAAADTLAVASSVRGLRELNLGLARLGDRGAQALANTTALTALEVLRVSYCGLTPIGTRSLLTSPALSSLRLLEVYGQDMSAEERSHLRDEFRGRLVC